MFTENICCNCRYYEGVHESAGCAPCKRNKIMVLWTNSCKYIWLIPQRIQVEKRIIKYIELEEINGNNCM